MEGYINENRWVDLSGLPRFNGKSRLINWKQCVGCIVPFRYDVAYGNIHILDYKIKSIPTLVITIDKYATAPFEVSSDFFMSCRIKRYVENRIIDFRPDLVKYLDNKEDAYRFAVRSKEKRPMHCPICGAKKSLRIDQVSQKGLFCNNCSDGKSLPNKLMFSVLRQLEIPFISEVGKNHGFNWMSTYRYDFYFKLNNEDVLIEMDGGYHDLEYQQKNDEIKSNLAKQNGFKLIRIDCKYDQVDAVTYIQNNINTSELSAMLCLQTIDWIKCRRDICTNLITEVCNLWEHHFLSTKEIGLKLGICSATAYKYLKYGKEIGLCPTYNIKESNRRGRIYAGKHIALLYNNKVINAFKTTEEASIQLEKIIKYRYATNSINNICLGIRRCRNGFDLKYITKEEYLQYKMIENNNIEVVKEERDYDKSSSN